MFGLGIGLKLGLGFGLGLDKEIIIYFFIPVQCLPILNKGDLGIILSYFILYDSHSHM